MVWISITSSRESVTALVPDNYANAALEPGYDRLYGILFGMVLLEPVVLVTHLIAQRGLKQRAELP